jgi:hypothetical protein
MARRRWKYAPLGRGRNRSEENFTMSKPKSGVMAKGTRFKGRGAIKPWIEARLTFGIEEVDEWRLMASKDLMELISAMVKMLQPGGRLMVTYVNLPLTAALLERGVPPPLTPLGHVMFMCGLTSFKDWYFAEGFLEGDVKLQGEVAMTAGKRRAQTRKLLAECEKYLEGAPYGNVARYKKLLSRMTRRAGTNR